MSHKRILLAGLFHETNTFAPGEMGLDQFDVKRGASILQGKGDGSPIGAFLEEAERFGWEVVPTIDVRGTPGPMPSTAVYDFFLEALEKSIAGLTAPVDALFIVLHGAMASPGLSDVEGDLLERLRQHAPFAELPIFGVLDLHANFTPAMAAHANALVVYRKNPHTDAAEVSALSTRLMEQTMREGRSLQTAFFGTDIVWPAPGTATAARPMLTLEAIAREEERDGIEVVNIFAGFAHADTPHTGVSFSIVYDPTWATQERVEALGRKLQATAEAEKALGVPHEWDLDKAIVDAQEKGLYPCCIVEPADNVGGGGPADGTAILRAFLKHGVQGGVVIADPESVAALQGVEPGTEVSLRVGGKTFSGDRGPVDVQAKLIRLTDGCYTLEDRHSHAASMSGVHMVMGLSAVVEVGAITILLTSVRSAPMDLGQWRSQGVDPASLQFIGVKAAVAHRQAYDRISKASYWVSTPGPCATDLRTLPFRLVRRPVYPLDL